MEYYSSVFTFDDWYLDKPVGTLAQQYDHLSRSLLVTGDLPDGYIWHMLIQCGDNFNIVLMEPIEDEEVGTAEDQPTEGSNDSNGADGTGGTEETPDPSETPETPKKKLIGAVLERGWVSEAGKYSVQLRGIKGDTVRHTNLITIRIPKSIAGEAQWPEVPSEFTQIEQRVNETFEQVKKTAADAEKAKNAIENMSATAESVEPDKEASVEKVVLDDGSVRLDFHIPKGGKGDPGDVVAHEGLYGFEVNADGYLELHYADDTEAPALSINEDGYLVADI